MKHKGSCHCGAIEIELETDRLPKDQVVGACQCSFCRKHNARTFSDPKARAVLIARMPEHVQLYTFGLMTSQQIVCRRCGVYMAMAKKVLADNCVGAIASAASGPNGFHKDLRRPQRSHTVLREVPRGIPRLSSDRLRSRARNHQCARIGRRGHQSDSLCEAIG